MKFTKKENKKDQKIKKEKASLSRPRHAPKEIMESSISTTTEAREPVDVFP